MKWTISFVTAEGQMSTTQVDALTESEALAASSINKSRIKSVKRSFLRNIYTQVTTSRLTVFDQATLLSTLSASAISGQPMDQVFLDFIHARAALKKREFEIMQTDRIPERLALMNIDPQARMLVEAGEGSGDLGPSMRRAAQELTSQKKMMSNITSALVLPIIIIIAALSALIILPIFFVPLLHSFQNSGIDIHGTIATRISEDISIFMVAAWPWLILLGVLAFWRRGDIWAQICDLGPFRMINEYRKTRRAVSFLTLFRPLYERGIPIERILRTQLQSSNRNTARIFEGMLEEVKRGNTFSKTLSSSYWPRFMVTGLSGFEATVPKAQREILDSLVELLIHQVETLSDRIASMISMVGYVLGIAAIFLLAFGILYPIITASAL